MTAFRLDVSERDEHAFSHSGMTPIRVDIYWVLSALCYPRLEILRKPKDHFYVSPNSALAIDELAPWS
jgi:hypothetical protein